ncbi:hypothetical protein AC249_AIPGENE5503 [Exaiptasia diaphana]|nr:hypothetical protein AC249_AIPGENE5503 [Exaiptasia diaphana]
MCTNCEKKRNQMVLEENSIEKLTHDFENVHVEERVNDPEVKLKSTAHSLPILSPALPPATPGSLYHPSDGSSSSSHEKLFSNPNRMSLETPRQHLNEFLAVRGISTVCHTLATPWNEISERTKRLHTRKARQIAKKNNITLCQVDYLDPQGGKGPCDRKAATIKGHIKIYLNEGHDVETAEQMVTAIEFRGGVPEGTASSAVCFTNVTASRKVKPKSSDDDVVDTATPPLESEEDDDQSLFFCTEKG